MPYPNGFTLDSDFTGGTMPAGWTFNRAGTATDSFYTDAAGSGYNTFANDVPRFLGATGWIFESQARINYLLNSTAPATQTTGTLTASPFILWVIGTGSATVTAGTGAATGGLGTATPGNPLFFTVTTAGTFVVTVTGSLNRFQLERGGAPTSFIVTAGTTVTRAVETCTYALGGWFSLAAGTLAVQVQYQQMAGINSVGILSLDDTTLNNRFTLSINPNGQLIVTTGGVTQVNVTQNVSVTAGQPQRLVGRYSSTDMRGASWGVLTSSQTGKTMPTITRLAFVIGATATQGCTILVQRAQYWPFAMADADLLATSQHPPQSQLTASGRGFTTGGIARSQARVRPTSIGVSFGSGRATAVGSSIARLSSWGIGIGGGVARPSVLTLPPPRILVPPPDVSVVGYDTLLLDRDLWDLVVDAYGNIGAAQSPYAIAQDVASAVRLFLGELWYDTGKGIPYFEEVLGHAPPLPLLKSLIEQAALSVPRVAAARAFVTEAKDRTVTGQVQVTTTAGANLVIVETFLGNAPG